MTQSFDHRPDPALGTLLREGLDAGNHAGFVAQVRALIAAEPTSRWAVLASWLRPGLAAAAALALLTALSLQLVGNAAEPVTFAEAVVSSGVPEAAITGAPGPSTDLLLAAVVEGR